MRLYVKFGSLRFLIPLSPYNFMFRIGLGQDSHCFTQDKNKPFVLGGVIIPNENGLKADSDGDVILHSICNALSSAIGGNSLGTWADEMCLEQGIKDSAKYVEYIFNVVKNKKYKVDNVSISVEAKKPRLTIEQIKSIKEKISKLLEINTDQVGITFTSGEGLTAFGRGEGIQVLSIILLSN